MHSGNELLAIARDAAREAGQLIQAQSQVSRTEVGTKSSITDMVTEVDRASERMIVSRILSMRPDDGIVGEEGSARRGTSGVRWIIDPLDGTTNYLYGIRAYSVSIAVEQEGAVVGGVVYDPAHGELFEAATGRGARLNGDKISTSRAPTISVALAGTGFGYQSERRAKQAAMLGRLIPQLRDIRRAGSAALDLCAVACGRLDAYFEWGLQYWDYAAGMLIVREAGGVSEIVASYEEAPLVAASNATLAKEFINMVHSAADETLGEGL